MYNRDALLPRQPDTAHDYSLLCRPHCQTVTKPVRGGFSTAAEGIAALAAPSILTETGVLSQRCTKECAAPKLHMERLLSYSGTPTEVSLSPLWDLTC